MGDEVFVKDRSSKRRVQSVRQKEIGYLEVVQKRLHHEQWIKLTKILIQVASLTTDT